MPDTPPTTSIDTPSAVALLTEAPSLAGNAVAPVATDDIILVRTASTAGSGGTAAGRAESIAFDPVTDRAFVTNAAQGAIDIIQISATGSAALVGTISLTALPSYGTVNSVAVKNGIVAVAYQNVTAGGDGVVALFDTAGTFLKTVTVGNLPDQLTFTADGQRILVANEGETVNATLNPVGSVSIISLAGGAGNAAVTQTIGFAGLNALDGQLVAAGTPRSIAGFTRAQEAEPEYVAISPDGTRAYVTLQELNLVAVIDLTNPNATEPLSILPLGAVDYTLTGNVGDFSDRDGIDLINADVEGLLMPDAIASFAVGGVTYFVTANEGDSRDFPGVLDEVRVGASSYVLDPTAYPNAVALKDNNALGRLTVLTTAGDTDGDGDIDQITAFGGRGISIFRQNADGTITKVRETGGEFERIIARDYATVFNGENNAAFDSRSDNKAAEPEGVTIGTVNGRIYAFVSLERAGGVMIYDVSDPANASFVGYRPPSANDYAPEVITFVSAADSPTGSALVLTANEASGTTTVYTVQAQTATSDVLTGGLDNDRLDGRAGNDTLVGGLGGDVLLGGDGVDTASYADNQGSVFVSLDTGRGFSNAAEGDTLVGIENVLGGLFRDTLIGNGGVNVLNGAGADDVLIGGLGADTLVGGDGVDTASYADNQGAVFINLDIARGFNNAAEGDVFLGIENVLGTAYRDTIIGDGSRNQLDGGAGNDILIGGLGADILIGGDGEDTVSYADNQGSAFVNLDIARGFNNAAEGDTYSDIENAIGGAFADTLIGDAGSNRLEGGLGADTLVGNGGADQFAFAAAMPGHGTDRILDFASGTDKIALLAGGFGLSAGPLAADAFVAGTAATTASQRIIYDATTGTLAFDADGNGAGAAVAFALLDTKPALTATDFIVYV